MAIDCHHFPALPDIVRDARLEAEIFATHTKNVSYASGTSVHERRLRTEELWFRDRQLGHGAYGIVHLERCERGGHARLRAVKQIQKNIASGEPLDYARELEAIMKFSHRNYTHCFVRSDGWYESPDYVFITMEYLEHGDLQRHLTRPLPEHEAKLITSQILEGLKLMHENGFTHRDLKPGNIMVVTKGPGWFVKIADFGITKRRHQDATSLHTLQRGSLGFAAPEALGLNSGQGSYTSAVDMWSLGAVVYIMLTTLTPFAPFEVFQYAAGQLDFPLESLKKLAVSTHGQDFIASLMRVNGPSRLSSADANTHPWMTKPSTVILDTTGASHTIISTPSALWSTITDCSSEPLATITVLATPTTEIPAKHTTPYYHSRSVEDCVDETQEGDRKAISPYSPYVLDDATTAALEVPHSKSPVSVGGQSVSSCENDALSRSPRPDSRASRPHLSRGKERADLRRKTSTKAPESAKISVAQHQPQENVRDSAPPSLPRSQPSIELFYYHDPASVQPSLLFKPIARTLSDGTEKVRVGRYSEYECQPLPSVTDAQPSTASVGFKTKAISRRHCEFWCEDGKWYIKDTRSSRGTFLNGTRLSPAFQESMASQVLDGDIVQLGVNVERDGEYSRCVKMILKLSHDWSEKSISPSTSNDNLGGVGESALQSSTNSMAASECSFDETDNASYNDDQSLSGLHIRDHAQEQGIDPSAKPLFWKTCFFCDDAYGSKIQIPSGPIEPAPCQHWLCHSCLMERFALAIISEEEIIQCCGQVIPARLFRRILVDPEVNALALKPCRASAKSSVYHRFIWALLRNRLFDSVYIADQICIAIGDDEWRWLVESALKWSKR